MRALLGAGTPEAAADRGAALLWLLDPDVGLLMILIPPPDAGPEPTWSTGLLSLKISLVDWHTSVVMSAAERERSAPTRLHPCPTSAYLSRDRMRSCAPRRC